MCLNMETRITLSSKIKWAELWLIGCYGSNLPFVNFLTSKFTICNLKWAGNLDIFHFAVTTTWLDFDFWSQPRFIFKFVLG